MKTDTPSSHSTSKNSISLFVNTKRDPLKICKKLKVNEESRKMLSVEFSCLEQKCGTNNLRFCGMLLTYLLNYPMVVLVFKCSNGMEIFRNEEMKTRE